MKSNYYQFFVQMKCLSPLSHIGERVGNQSNLRAVKILGDDQKLHSIFAYSANALRNGILRRNAIASMLTKLDIKVSPVAHQTLFSGGYIDGGIENDLDLDAKVRRLLPALSVLGTAKPKGVFGTKGSQMLPGRICLGDGYLVCSELPNIFFDVFPSEMRNKLREKAIHSYWNLITEIQKTRKDEIRHPEYLEFLDETIENTVKTSQFIIQDWLIIAGATLCSRWAGKLTELELGAVVDALGYFAQAPTLGGKVATGNGLIELKIVVEGEKGFSETVEISPRATLVSDKLLEFQSAYQEHLTTNKGQIEELLKA